MAQFEKLTSKVQDAGLKERYLLGVPPMTRITRDLRCVLCSAWKDRSAEGLKYHGDVSSEKPSVGYSLRVRRKENEEAIS